MSFAISGDPSLGIAAGNAFLLLCALVFMAFALFQQNVIQKRMDSIAAVFAKLTFNQFPSAVIAQSLHRQKGSECRMQAAAVTTKQLEPPENYYGVVMPYKPYKERIPDSARTESTTSSTRSSSSSTTIKVVSPESPKDKILRKSGRRKRSVRRYDMEDRIGPAISEKKFESLSHEKSLFSEMSRENWVHTFPGTIQPVRKAQNLEKSLADRSRHRQRRRPKKMPKDGKSVGDRKHWVHMVPAMVQPVKRDRPDDSFYRIKTSQTSIPRKSTKSTQPTPTEAARKQVAEIKKGKKADPLDPLYKTLSLVRSSIFDEGNAKLKEVPQSTSSESLCTIDTVPIIRKVESSTDETETDSYRNVRKPRQFQ